ncbi:uncharacterized protein LOC129595126 [Paramacrobiotus metropolitanus]|uniref:uncharacterized protein LOC129595126 n=1 Tax=Paramacrobiotus metropolitanus TaxID=2943436 RepID=UPI002445E078|nr:uncharacterized protein LOC129595126 [Paramacrobiotus metropolitanus]
MSSVIDTVENERRKNICYSRALRTLGAAEILCGCYLITLDIIAFSTFRSAALYIDFRASGLWAGLLYLVSGALAVHSGRPIKPNRPVAAYRCPLTATVAISALCTFSAMCLSVPFAYSISNTYVYCIVEKAHCTIFTLRCAYLGGYLIAFILSVSLTTTAALSLHRLMCGAKVTERVEAVCGPCTAAAAVERRDTHPPYAPYTSVYPPSYFGRSDANHGMALSVYPVTQLTGREIITAVQAGSEKS